MFDSPIDWLIIVVVILVLFGSTKKIPDLARNIGKASGEFKRGQMEIEKEIKNAMNAPAATPTASAGVDYFQVAKSLGIDTQNKNEKQVKDEIADKLKSGQ
ncbi:MAG: twin-arginine translocase TatA/TatE family subunit [Candidatus Thermoplasmatota archaeon]|jgi:sec-independent protein translocase protein TatA|nr:twin-arginine translocase TatA/TatE family subunit [Candidatus Thermoplasmatota archaeon]MCL5678863.1 twin-arginine translocase TatA/TatE family subunit [Candidatus Thermoplasmatota archaeon]